jgi:uncharacterized protein with HEPN domain
MKRDQALFITDIHDSIVLIEKYLHDMKFEDFSDNLAIQDAVAMRLAIIGEAATKVTISFRNSHIRTFHGNICAGSEI